MAQQAAALQGCNNEVVRCLEDLRLRRDELARQIRRDEEERERLRRDVRALGERLERVSDSLARKAEARDDLDKILAETDAAYVKILNSFRALLSVLKQEAGGLSKTAVLESNVT
ncbi:PREDICTED: Sjoegren syndrome nuclear autoantigen 1 homolog [Gavialis gangeticus]|uniref:Sjoegren syndrome nuclear autoantigen 1 homolog n=1 Tax=Gavialis gangeticus TaxID=94835 RepID=UPI00092F3C32|nr:PREDICTED: Sjoegren syndrome nuclear autoantigen 1 homolog [Gavialis gangeticus]